jgi:hypothetical protein
MSNPELAVGQSVYLCAKWDKDGVNCHPHPGSREKGTSKEGGQRHDWIQSKLRNISGV